MALSHIPVMVEEVIAWLNPRPGGVYVDGTLGGAGHAHRICSRIQPDGLFIGIDRDADAVAHAAVVLSEFAPRVRLFHANYTHLPRLLQQIGQPAVDGLVLDLGLSLHQIEASGRGFSFRREEPLDMRMDTRNLTTAAGLVNTLSEAQLADLIFSYGEERYARRIARAIVAQRQRAPIATSSELAGIVRAAGGGGRSKSRIDPATRTFMALRIAVNEELSSLETALAAMPALLRCGGRLCVLTFHSLEDRIVKRALRELSRNCTCPPLAPRCTCNVKPAMKPLTRRALKPSAAEIQANPLARSAKLRVAERL